MKMNLWLDPATQFHLDGKVRWTPWIVPFLYYITSKDKISRRIRISLKLMGFLSGTCQLWLFVNIGFEVSCWTSCSVKGRSQFIETKCACPCPRLHSFTNTHLLKLRRLTPEVSCWVCFLLCFWELLLLFTLFLRLELWLPVGMDQTLVLYISKEPSLSSRCSEIDWLIDWLPHKSPPLRKGKTFKYIQIFSSG